MPLTVGSGLAAWCNEHQATPLADESYPWPDLPVSVLPIEIANSEGHIINTIVGWCNSPENMGVLEPGPGVLVATFVPFTHMQPAPTQKTMYDSVTWQAIPADAEVVAGYVDGLYAWPQEAWDRFPNAKQVRIAVFPTTDDGDVLDCEPGDADPSDCPYWIRMRQNSPNGLIRPTIYCSLSAVPAVQAACAGLEYDLWIAHYTGVEHLERGSAATQYASPEHGSGGNYDLSLCESWWPRDNNRTFEVVP